MKMTGLPPTRTNVSIELTPDEQDALFSLVGSLVGTGPIRQTTDALYELLKAANAKEMSYQKDWNLQHYVW